jgi:hypothetical protein
MDYRFSEVYLYQIRANIVHSVLIFEKPQENYYWLDRVLRSYQSRVYSGDVGSTFEVSV